MISYTISIVDRYAQLNPSTRLRIIYVEWQTAMVVIHGHIEGDFAGVDFAENTLRVRQINGSDSTLKYVQSGAQHLGLGNRADLIFQLPDGACSEIEISDGSGFVLVMGNDK